MRLTAAQEELLSFMIPGLVEHHIADLNKNAEPQEITSTEAQKLNKIAPQSGPTIFAAFGPAVKDILASYPDAVQTSSTKAPLEITQQTYPKEVLESRLPVILDAYSPFCGPCKIMAPIFTNLSHKFKGKVKFVKLNIDEEPALSKQLQIQAMPTFLFIKDGKVLDRHTGTLSEEELSQKIDQPLL